MSPTLVFSPRNVISDLLLQWFSPTPLRLNGTVAIGVIGEFGLVFSVCTN